MCIAILKPIGANITDDEIRNCARANREGGGYAFVGKKGKMWVRKGFFDVEKFIEAYREDEKKFGQTSPALLHFRIATGSKVNEDNCHPFVFKHGALIHNGWFFPSTQEKSDTRLLTERIGDWLTRDRAIKHREELSKYFGHNKVVLLYRDKTAVILNEDAGTWHNGVWFSNGGFRNYSVGFRPGPSCAVGTASRKAGENDPYDDTENFDNELDELWGTPRHRRFRPDSTFRPPVSDK